MAKQTLSDQAKERDNYTCVKCGKKATGRDLHTHHIVPKALGGRGVLSNIETLCFDCHRGTHQGELSPHAIARRNQANGGLSTRDLSRILSINSGVIHDWRSQGILPVVASIDDVERLVNRLEEKHKGETRKKSLYGPKRIQAMRQGIERYRETGHSPRPFYTSVVKFFRGSE